MKRKERAMRLIDADALHDDINKETYRHTYIEQIHSIIDNAPTIDIAEVCGECNPYNPCIYCKHEFENKFETCGERRKP